MSGILESVLSGAAEILQPFPLLSLDDLVLQHVLTFLSLLERKAVRATCRKLCKVASAAVQHFHVEKPPGDSYLEYLNLHEKFPNVQVSSAGITVI